MRCLALSTTLLISTLVSGCSTATHISARVAAGTKPLDAIAKSAAAEYAVDRIDDNRLRLRDSWVWSSIGGIGYYASIANLHHDPASNKLHLEYYLRANPLMTLWIPVALHAEPGFVGGALKGTMNGQINDILGWANATSESRSEQPIGTPFPSSAASKK